MLHVFGYLIMVLILWLNTPGYRGEFLKDTTGILDIEFVIGFTTRILGFIRRLCGV